MEGLARLLHDRCCCTLSIGCIGSENVGVRALYDTEAIQSHKTIHFRNPLFAQQRKFDALGASADDLRRATLAGGLTWIRKRSYQSPTCSPRYWVIQKTMFAILLSFVFPPLQLVLRGSQRIQSRATGHLNLIITLCSGEIWCATHRTWPPTQYDMARTHRNHAGCPI